ncbi:CopD family protein [Piscinibacter sp.]|uniref:CopD family protein n=1 Tax=Piscinibacter sp. TaxID=1903157 RepID=UPI002CB3BF4F|nr:CopD family protein [Albitalea sp.]HUG25036.1 CopD family protein [Albitalea sp.]
MPWLKLFHIVSLIAWCGVLLYLPAAIAAGSGRTPSEIFHGPHGGMARTLFTVVATPAALLTIVSGTALILLYGLPGYWLMGKLTVVAAMVLCHVLCGALILRVERNRDAAVGARCAVLGTASALLIFAAAWLVLRKPF